MKRTISLILLLCIMLSLVTCLCSCFGGPDSSSAYSGSTTTAVTADKSKDNKRPNDEAVQTTVEQTEKYNNKNDKDITPLD